MKFKHVPKHFLTSANFRHNYNRQTTFIPHLQEKERDLNISQEKEEKKEMGGETNLHLQCLRCLQKRRVDLEEEKNSSILFSTIMDCS